MFNFFNKPIKNPVNNFKNPCILQFFDIELPLKDQVRNIGIKAVINDSDGNKIILNDLIFSLENRDIYNLYKKHILNKKININIELLKSSLIYYEKHTSINPLINNIGFEAFFNCKKTNFLPSFINYDTENNSVILLYQTDGYKNKICLLEKTNNGIFNKDNIFIDIPNAFHEIILNDNKMQFYKYADIQKKQTPEINIENKYCHENIFIYSYYFIKEINLPLNLICSLIEQFCLNGLNSDDIVLNLLNIKKRSIK